MTSNTNYHIAIVIVGYRNTADIVRCVAALSNLTYKKFEVIVCENGGDAAYANLRSALPIKLIGGQEIKMISAPSNGGYAAGINIGISASSHADAWWILNPDTEPLPDALAALLARLLEGCDAVGGPILFPSGEVQSVGGHWQGLLAKAVSIGFGFPLAAVPSRDVIESRQNFLSGASMLVGRRFLQLAGLMPERYFLYCEEVAWFLSAKREGLQLGFAPKGIVVHYQGTTTGYSKSPRSRSCHAVYLDERNKMLLTREFYPFDLPVAATMSLIRIILRYGRHGAFAQVVWGFRGWFMGLCGSAGIPHWVK